MRTLSVSGSVADAFRLFRDLTPDLAPSSLRSYARFVRRGDAAQLDVQTLALVLRGHVRFRPAVLKIIEGNGGLSHEFPNIEAFRECIIADAEGTQLLARIPEGDRLSEALTLLCIDANLDVFAVDGFVDHEDDGIDQEPEPLDAEDADEEGGYVES